MKNRSLKRAVFSWYTSKVIVKAALLLFRESPQGRELLFVRAHNKDYFVFPGGKQEKDETIKEALTRELNEELQATVSNVRKIGIVAGKTPEDTPMEMHLYTGSLETKPQIDNEIVEIKWCNHDMIGQLGHQMTPMTKEKVLPLLIELGLW